MLSTKDSETPYFEPIPEKNFPNKLHVTQKSELIEMRCCFRPTEYLRLHSLSTALDRVGNVAMLAATKLFDIPSTKSPNGYNNTPTLRHLYLLLLKCLRLLSHNRRCQAKTICHDRQSSNHRNLQRAR